MPTKTQQLPALLDEASYPDPEEEYETYDVTTTASGVQRGDVILLDCVETMVGRTSTGTKWTELFKTRTDHKIMRVPNHTEITVTRRRATDTYRDASQRADANRRIARNVAADLGDPNMTAATEVRLGLEKCIEKLDQGWLLQSNDIREIVTAQATAKIRAQWIDAVQYVASGGREDFNGDLIDLLDEFIADLKNRLVQMQSSFALSRSTSVIENVMTDTDMWAIAQFIDQARWWKF